MASGSQLVEILEPKETKRRNGKPPCITKLTTKKLIPFGWYGGKFSHLDWLLPLLPSCHHYCEPFAGSAAVLLNRKPSAVETYNDLDGEVCNFFRVLREDKEKLVERIGLTPFSREEFALACQLDPSLTPLERARRFYIRARQVRIGLAQTAISRPLGKLQKYESGGHERRNQPLARRSRNVAGNCSSAFASPDRKSPGHRCDSSLRFARYPVLLRSTLHP